jgi:ferredoxin-NADP reductase
MPALLVSHRRPGFYFRVIEEGEIGMGDEIVKIADGPERVTVQQIDGLLYLSDHNADQFKRALNVPALSTGWKGSLAALAAANENGDQSGNAGLAPSSPRPLWRGFRLLRVSAVQRESVNVLSFVLEAEDNSPLPAHLPGQFLVFKIELDKISDPIMRSYSISSPPGTGRYRVSVKRDKGAGSQYFHDQLRVGDLLQVSAPRGSFTLGSGDKPVVLLSAGIGATPVLAMLHALADHEVNSAREIWWCHGARNGKEHPFAAETQELLTRLPRSHSFIAYSKPDHGGQTGRNYDLSGHLTVSSLQQLEVPKDADFYLCGPPAFLASFMADLKAWSVAESQIHSEVFGAGSSLTPGIATTATVRPHPPAEDPGTGPRVSFTRSGITVPWNSRYESLLEFAEACDVPVKWSCRMGVCHTCESGLIDGRVSYTSEPLDRPAEGNVLICCSTPLTSIEVDL